MTSTTHTSTTDAGSGTASTGTASTGNADARELFAQAAAVATRVIDATSADHYRRATPCEAFDVEQLLGHLLFVMHRVATLGRDEPLGLVDETVTSLDWSADFRAATAEAVHAWADDTRLTDTVVLPWASMTGAQALGTYTNELTVHTWDLARAIATPVEWDDEVVAAALAAVRRELPVADRDPIWQSFLDAVPAEVSAGFSPPFANAVAIADDAPLIDQLVAWNGRRP